MSDYKQGRGPRAGCSGGWEEGVSQVKSVKRTTTARAHHQDGEHPEAMQGRDGQGEGQEGVQASGFSLCTLSKGALW